MRRSTRWINAIVAIASMSFLVTACSGGGTANQAESSASSGSDNATKSDKDYSIAIVPKDATNPWFVRMEQGVKKYAEDTGLTRCLSERPCRN